MIQEYMDDPASSCIQNVRIQSPHTGVHFQILIWFYTRDNCAREAGESASTKVEDGGGSRLHLFV